MLKYSLISRKNPITKESLYYANLAPVNPVGLNELAEDISNSCTLTVHDIKAVLSALEECVFKTLRNGQSARLGDLGSFHATISSSGAATEEEFSKENLRGVKVRFIPSSKLRYEMSMNNPNVKFLRQG
jgi:predicted histone-like DNA-binding protein